MRFYYDYKTHAVLDSVMDRVAVAAGTFQDELGCSGEWASSCVNTLLTDVDGDGVYTFQSTDIPAGSYEFKVAFDESWAVSVPGSNVQVTLSEPKTNLIITWDSATDQVTYTLQSSADLAQPALEHAIQDDIFYFVMPDRFQNGDVANDQGGLTGISLTHGFDPTDKGFYHGGDLSGLLEKMDYIEDMGVTAIWMTPMFKNRPVQGTGSDASAGYHGYWIEDFTQFDPHFGTNLELQQVITEAHNRGIKIFFDVIVNHTADVIQYQGGQSSYRNKTDYPYRDESGTPFDDRDYIGGTFPPLSSTVSFPYTPVFDTITDTNVKVPAWLNDPIYYHNRGNVSNWDDPEEGTYGDFFGLDDLFTEHPDVVAGMLSIYKDWVSFGVDGFRVDTVKHVNLEFWQEFAPEILAHAAAEGNPDFFIFGEVYSSDPAILRRYTGAGEMPAVLDFRFQEYAQAYAAAGGFSDALETFFADDDYFTDADSNVYNLPTFLGNHDMGRSGYFIAQNNVGAPDAELLARSKLAHALMYFARGVPVVYYGDEQGFTGDGGDKDAREDMFPSQVASYNDNDLIGTISTTAEANFDVTHPLFVAFKSYADLYQNHEALRSGAQIHRYSTDTSGIYAFSRIDRDDKIEYLVAFNNAETDQTATFSAIQVQGALVLPTYTAVYTAYDPSVPTMLTSDAQGQVTVTVPALSFVIYQATTALPASAEAPPIAFSTLQNGDALAGENDLAEIAVDLGSTDIFAEVTFAVRVGTNPEYETIGTDNNAPYRVFYDVSDLPLGTPVSIKAIVNDLSGHYDAVQVEVVVGEYEPPVSSLEYAVIHYHRPAGDYGDWGSSDFNDFWGLHLWGNAIDEPGITWDQPKKFTGVDDFGAYVAIKLQDATQPVNYIVHRGNDKDTPNDRSFEPSVMPELWIVQGDAANYGSRAAAQGYATVHYTRTAGDFDGWVLNVEGIATPIVHHAVDDFGAVYTIPVGVATEEVSFTVENTATVMAQIRINAADGPSRQFVPADHPTLWLAQGDDAVYTHRGGVENFAMIHYRRAAGDYGDYTSSDFNDFWGLHLWGDFDGSVTWDDPWKRDGEDDYGVYFDVPLIPDATTLNYIVHKGNEKDPGPDQSLDLTTTGYEIWLSQGSETQYTHPAIPLAVLGSAAVGDLSRQQAYWVDEETIAWAIADDASSTYYLHYDADAGLTLDDNGISGGEFITLTIDPAGLPPDVQAKFPHLASLPALKIDAADLSKVPAILKGQFAVSAIASGGELRDATGLQIPGVLDDLYTYGGELGVVYSGNVPSLNLWAPTAQTVTLHLFDDSLTGTTSITYAMAYDADYGVWSVTGDASWTGKYYLYQVVVFAPATGNIEHNLVTDPYAVSLAMNSTRSQIVDLNNASLKPANWGTYSKPDLGVPEDISVYELHVRDFSINDTTVPTDARGTFGAFIYTDTDGMQHLTNLADAGLTHLHLLPAFDIATINENVAERVEPDPGVLATYPPSSTQQQAIISPIRDQDGFNWGYDPLHYSVPEGSYSTNPDGTTRIVEFREMVQSLNGIGLRVVLDVVYNHTNASGQSPRAVLDRIVPGYYHRLNADGQVETSTCCANTASEHNMMEKLMIESVVLWAKQYKIDAFRFDLMGHHMKSNMLNLRAALDALTLANDGVDGSKIYLYGEGWNFGEVADGARGVNATQFNMAGTGIGTFSDRLRDAVRGGGPFDSGAALVTNQGFINGRYYDPNANNSGAASEREDLLLKADQIRVGLAGNLAEYEFVGQAGTVITGGAVDYNGSPAGYTADPQEQIVYISKHDNQTLYDNNQYKMPTDATMDERVRAQNVGLSIVSLSQGVPFLHAGSDMLRSKSMDRDSYNSGDWFNKLDFTYQDNNWGVGLPPADVSGQSDNWPIMAPLLADPALKPAPADIQRSVQHLREMLEIRASSPLFRLETLEEVQARLAFHNTGPSQIPGLIVMSLSDPLAEVDPNYSLTVVLFNATDEPQTFTEAAFSGATLNLHPVQADGYDPVVKTASFATGVFTVPARTTAVFVQAQVGPSLSITKDVTPIAGVPLGGVVTYTIVLSNSGDGAATGVVMTDELPPEVNFGGWLNWDGTAQIPDPPGDVITWAYPVSSGESYTIRFTATVTTNTAYSGAIVTNMAEFTSTNAAGGSDDASFTIEGVHRVYLPLVMRNF
ncbi:MAG: pullulanase-type alpha-1,6-glucosidase [Chloroflexota bacterium]|nr:pullulanase-type alpha-1,6-glucosidase [Chloroflexota bacterium]